MLKVLEIITKLQNDIKIVNQDLNQVNDINDRNIPEISKSCYIHALNEKKEYIYMELEDGC